MDKMVCFDPRDVIFLLNKWDSIIFSDDDTEDGVFEEIFEKLSSLWTRIKVDYVLKSAAGKVWN